MKKEKKKVKKWVYWTPRILSILFLAFLALFSLDVFELCNGFLECAGGLFMHNIFVFILLAILIIGWKKEWLPGSAFILGGLVYIVFITKNILASGFEWYYLLWALQIAGPAFFIGILFWINWKKRR